eukprot:RCo031903
MGCSNSSVKEPVPFAKVMALPSDTWVLLLATLHSREVFRFCLCGHLCLSGLAVRELRRRVRPHVFTGHTSPVFSCAFSPSGQRIVSASRDRTVKLWDTASGREVLTLHKHKDCVTCCHFSPADGRYVLTGSDDHVAILWDSVTGSDVVTFQGHTGWVLAVAFSPSGDAVATASKDLTARLWDLR